jgi:hypothetical protein
MKRMMLLLGMGMLAGAMAWAQDAPASSPPEQNAQTRTESSSRSTNVIRGCLSGSTGNYTVTDRNGMQYTVNGDDSTLRSMVGREVEVTVSEDRSTEDATHAPGTSTHSTNTVQASNVKAVGSSCNTAGSATPSGSTSPNATPEERPAPQMMAMLQQQEAPNQDNSKPNGAPPQVQSTPPVTSQTPASPNAPSTGANSQVGTSPANNSGMTESEANHDAQAARQGELNTNPQNGQTTGRGIDNQGVNNPSTTNPNAVPSSPNSATPSSNSQQSQADCAKTRPLYECQASDIPWANGSGGNTNTPAPPH